MISPRVSTVKTLCKDEVAYDGLFQRTHGEKTTTNLCYIESQGYPVSALGNYTAVALPRIKDDIIDAVGDEDKAVPHICCQLVRPFRLLTQQITSARAYNLLIVHLPQPLLRSRPPGDTIPGGRIPLYFTLPSHKSTQQENSSPSL